MTTRCLLDRVNGVLVSYRQTKMFIFPSILMLVNTNNFMDLYSDFKR